MMTANHLYLDGFNSHNPKKTIMLKLPASLEEIPKDWLDVPGMECTGPQQCLPAAEAKIQLLHVSHLWWGRWTKRNEVSGNYEVKFKDGAKFEGSFKGKVQDSSAKLVCE